MCLSIRLVSSRDSPWPGAALQYSLGGHWLAESKTVPGTVRMVKAQTGPVHCHVLFTCARTACTDYRKTDSASPFARCSNHIPSIEHPPLPVSHSTSLPPLSERNTASVLLLFCVSFLLFQPRIQALLVSHTNLFPVILLFE